MHFHISQIVLSLYYVHQSQILHRDLKTQNIFLTRSLDHVKIGDFGISKILSTKSKAFTVVGTPCYISPELCEGGHFVDSRWGLQFLLLQYHSKCYAFLTFEGGQVRFITQSIIFKIVGFHLGLCVKTRKRNFMNKEDRGLAVSFHSLQESLTTPSRMCGP